LTSTIVAGAVLIGIVVGVTSFAVVNGEPNLSPAEIAEVRAEEYATFLEESWLADPVNVATARAEEQARISERKWLADPANVARLRAELFAEMLEARYLAGRG
jgi:hypothetical protein